MVLYVLMSRRPLGLHCFHAAFLDAVIGIIETARILDQMKFLVLAVAKAATANIDESGLAEGGGKRFFVPHPQMGGAPQRAARKSDEPAGRVFKSGMRGANKPRIAHALPRFEPFDVLLRPDFQIRNHQPENPAGREQAEGMIERRPKVGIGQVFEDVAGINALDRSLGYGESSHDIAETNGSGKDRG